MLEQIFLKVIDMSLAASMVMAAVFIVRILLKRFPKYISYMLWSVVLFRLLCPVTLESAISPVPNLKPAFYEYTSGKNDISTAAGDNSRDELSPVEFAVIDNDGEAEIISETGQAIPTQVHPDVFQPDKVQPDTNVKDPKVSRQELFILFGKYVWISGIGIMLLYFAVSVVRIRRKVSVSIPLKENIYITDERISSFVMGILRPRIYSREQ